MRQKDFGFYAHEIQEAKKDARKFEKVTGVPFTISNARRALLGAAQTTMVYFSNDTSNPRLEQSRARFHKILRSLPRKTLAEISQLIKAEIFAHLRLNYGNLAADWLILNL